MSVVMAHVTDWNQMVRNFWERYQQKNIKNGGVNLLVIV